MQILGGTADDASPTKDVFTKSPCRDGTGTLHEEVRTRGQTDLLPKDITSSYVYSYGDAFSVYASPFYVFFSSYRLA